MWLNIIQFRIETNILRFEHSIPIILGVGRSGRMILSVCVFNAASRQCVCVSVSVCSMQHPDSVCVCVCLCLCVQCSSQTGQL